MAPNLDRTLGGKPQTGDSKNDQPGTQDAGRGMAQPASWVSGEWKGGGYTTLAVTPAASAGCSPMPLFRAQMAACVRLEALILRSRLFR